MQQARDFLIESEDVDRLISGLSDEQLQSVTDFKSWTIADVIAHLHMWNEAALLSLTDPEGFQAFFAPIGEHLMKGGDLKSFERARYADLSAHALVQQWRETYHRTADAFAVADPSTRVEWVGPSMSARSSITARQMETWAHAQAIYDVLGRDRVDSDRIQNIVVLGVNTFGWTFKNRRLEVPEAMPHLVLKAPSGAIWTYGEPSESNVIRGDAVEFAQVVTQTRNVLDTGLSVQGDIATLWMNNAQCFAGGPNPVPAPGSRKKH